MFRNNQDRNPVVVIWILAVVLGLLGLLARPSQADGGTIAKLKAYTVTCSGTARTMAASTTRPELTPGNAITFTNGATQIFIGSSNVDATTNGYPVAVDAEKTMDVKPGELWCITAGGSSTVEVLAGSF